MRANLSGRNSSRFGKSSSKKKPWLNVSTSTWIVIFIFIAAIIVIAIVCSTSDSFGNVGEMFKGVLAGNGGKLKDLQIFYFMSPTCPWCRKMTDVLKTENELSSVTVVDVSKPEGQQMAKKMGAHNKGIPAFISRKNRTGAVGFKKSVNELIKSLDPSNRPTPKTPQSNPNTPNGNNTHAKENMANVHELGLVVFVSSSCGWCTKLKDDLRNAGIYEQCEIVDVSTPEGQQMAKSVLTNFRGVPCVYSKKTQKQSVGYKPIDQIIQSLR